MPDRGIYIRVTHLGTIPSSILLADVGLGEGGRLSGIPRAGPHYVPVNGYVDLQYTEPVVLSYTSGNIKTFLDRGFISVVMMSGQEVHDAVQAWHGWADYNDSSGHQPTAADVWKHLTNDGAGVLTNTTYLPRGIASFYNTNTNLIDLEGTRVGDVVHVRVDLTITPSVNNGRLHLRIWFLEGWALERRLARMDEGAGVPYHIVEGFRFYIGRDAVRLGGARVEVLTGSDASVVVNGFFIELV